MALLRRAWRPLCPKISERPGISGFGFLWKVPCGLTYTAPWVCRGCLAVVPRLLHCRPRVVPGAAAFPRMSHQEKHVETD
eukprot:4899758-Pyramimonas_sp.AAC.1